MVKIKPLSFDFEAKEDTLWDKHIVLEKSQVCKIIAPSGSGKSTIVSILSGIRSDYTGELFYNSTNARNTSQKFWSNLRSNHLSMVYQDLRLFKNLTVRQNIQISQEISKDYLPSEPIEFFAEKLEIQNQLDQIVCKLSFGQMQRVAIIRAILRKFDWIILDEPFCHLDRNIALKAWELILNQVKMRNAGIIIACLDPYDFIYADKTFYL